MKKFKYTLIYIFNMFKLLFVYLMYTMNKLVHQ